MSITSNEGGTLYELETITVNESGTLYELDTVHSNENGTLQEIFAAWSFPELVDYYEANPNVTFIGTSRSWSLDGNTYSATVTGQTTANFTLTGKTKITVNLTKYSYGYNYGAFVTYAEGVYDGSELNPSMNTLTYIQGLPTGQTSYDTVKRLEFSIELPKGDYFITAKNWQSTTAAQMKFTIKFEKA